ncbi:MAG: hypothetical protein ABIP78_10090 [Pyrinomonadaceae bacterium]
METSRPIGEELREHLVAASLAWEIAYGNAPQITTVLSEYDAAKLVDCSLTTYSKSMQGISAVQKGHDFVFQGVRYQVKGNRPSGKKGSFVTWVPKATNYDWDYLIWILYNPKYQIQEAWQWDVVTYKSSFDMVKRLSPANLRLGMRLA